MDEVYICELCQRAYKAKWIKKGVWELRQFNGYTVDLQLQQFRKLVHWKLFGDRMYFIPFASSKGRTLLAQMHEQVTR